jgi:hypothetical protein
MDDLIISWCLSERVGSGDKKETLNWVTGRSSCNDIDITQEVAVVEDLKLKLLDPGHSKIAHVLVLPALPL